MRLCAGALAQGMRPVSSAGCGWTPAPLSRTRRTGSSGPRQVQAPWTGGTSTLSRAIPCRFTLQEGSQPRVVPRPASGSSALGAFGISVAWKLPWDPPLCRRIPQESFGGWEAPSAGSIVERVADDDLEVGAIHHPCFHLSEKPLASLDPEEEIEATSRVILALGVGPYERRSTTGVDVPRFAGGVGEVIRQLEVEGVNSQVIAQTDLDVRSESDPIDKWLGFVMPADHKLIGIGRGSDADANVLCRDRSCGQTEKDSEGTQAQQCPAK